MVRRSGKPSMSQTVEPNADAQRRQRWLSLLAKAPSEHLEALWEAFGKTPTYVVLRRPEIGLVMVQGRVSGSGAAFCAGEMTVTRAAVRLQTGEVGIGYAGGRSLRQAELVALIDALGQRAEWREQLEARIVAPLAAELEERRRRTASRAAATRVEFFTVAREAGI
jgi:alpha-D-ribose 1-methylphosphonate 5-triphosphate synthase subunit PhnG